MNGNLRVAWLLCLAMCAAMPALQADELRMHNGDCYFGTVVSVSTNSVVFESGVLGRITLPRQQVALIAFPTNAAEAARLHPAEIKAGTNNASHSVASVKSVRTNAEVSALLDSLGTNAGPIQQVRDRMLLGNPEATSQYDELVSGLLSGEVNLDDLRRKAESSAGQIRALKQDLGPEVGDSLDLYLQVLDHFVEQTAPQLPNPSP